MQTETHRLRVYYRNTDGDEVDTVQTVTMPLGGDDLELRDAALFATMERDDFGDFEGCDPVEYA